LHPDEHVGHRCRKAIDADCAARETALARHRRTFCICPAGLKHDGLSGERATFWETRMDREPHLTLRRNLPQHGPRFRTGPPQLEIAGSYLMATGDFRQMRHQDKRQQQ
jgi:hypothetical protein